MRIVCKEQHTAEWMQLRTGIYTGSRSADGGQKLSRASKNGVKGDWGAKHWAYVEELAWEQITGVAADHYVSKPMEIGTQYEGEARVEFWMRYGAEVEETGLVLHPTLNYLGASPDGYVMENGVAIPIELKVPLAKTHQLYLGEGVVPEIYVPQLMTEMLCCDRAPYGYFASYCPPDIFPALPDHMRMFRVKLMADEAKFAEIEEAATATMEHVIERVAKLRAMYPEKGAPKSKFRAELETAVLAQESGRPGRLCRPRLCVSRWPAAWQVLRVTDFSVHPCLQISSLRAFGPAPNADAAIHKACFGHAYHSWRAIAQRGNFMIEHLKTVCSGMSKSITV